jgi:NADPH2:quinone reductase
LSLAWRARLRPGERVLVLGATGAAGTIAVQAARLLGASHVVAAGRDPERLARLHALGATASVTLDGDVDDLTGRLAEATHGGADVVVDLIWGTAAVAAMRTAASRCRYVQVGHVADPAASLPASVIRAAPLTIMGYANFHVPLDARRGAYAHLMSLAARSQITLELERIPLRDIARAWTRQGAGPGHKLVILP